jgi:hypothetical protein
MLQQVDLLLVCHRAGKDRFLSCKSILESAITSNRQQLDVSLLVFYSTFISLLLCIDDGSLQHVGRHQSLLILDNGPPSLFSFIFNRTSYLKIREIVDN